MKRIIRWLFQLGVIAILVLLLFEVCYRFSVIDFYKVEFQALNPGKESTSVDYLVFGDSFTAAGNNYVDRLRKIRDKTFINAAVPGLGIKQVNTFANRRIRKHSPKKIIYQIYVGNDLTDVDHLANYKTLPLIRNLYWDVSDMLISTSYINYRLATVTPQKKSSFSQIPSYPYKAAYYNFRSKLYLTADSEYLYKTVTITEEFEERYQIWQEHIKIFIEKNSEDTPIYLLFIPHCSQVNDYYRSRFENLGAVFKDASAYSDKNYSFIKKAFLDLSNYKNVTLLNPIEFLRKNDTIGHRLYHNNDPHLNDAGFKVLVDYLKEQLP